MKLFNRKHPYICMAAAIYIAGAKFPFDYWINNQNVTRRAKMKGSKFGLLYDDRPVAPTIAAAGQLYDAWERVEGKAPDGNGDVGRLSHNLTNLIIEWVRLWTPTAVKFLCALFVYGQVLAIAAFLL